MAGDMAVVGAHGAAFFKRNHKMDQAWHDTFDAYKEAGTDVPPEYEDLMTIGQGGFKEKLPLIKKVWKKIKAGELCLPRSSEEANPGNEGDENLQHQLGDEENVEAAAAAADDDEEDEQMRQAGEAGLVPSESDSSSSSDDDEQPLAKRARGRGGGGGGGRAKVNNKANDKKDKKDKKSKHERKSRRT